ncbi:MAG: DUF4430 domain-containing protein [Oscillospiraceae bacterium]|nr:DUF4430 domain-containing protein [Oscillospiraceae bacterium]
MNLNSTKKLLSLVLCIVLIAAMALLATGCGNKENPETQPPQATEPSIPADVTVKGEGKTSFYFNVTNTDGTVTKFLVKTDKKTVGEALLETKLITGDPSDYGLYVTSVNGITADWNTECAYWAFYINGEYAQTGVDATDITAGATYGFTKTISYTVKGEGATKFYLDVVNTDKTITKFEIHTNKKTVGEALLELELITGNPSDYGLYVTSVNGITADWDTEKAYWAFYIGGEYAQTGVDATDITADAAYSFVKTVSE